jgi:C-terminal processing protease CtpA/Prc
MTIETNKNFFISMKKIYIITFISLACTYSYGQELNTLSPSEKIYGLSKFWTEVNYNFAYFDNIPTLNWDSTYKAYIPKVLETKSDIDYYNLLIRFAALLKDGHTRIWYPGNYHLQMSSTMFGEHQLYIENIGSKAIVVRTNASKINEIPIGSEIIEVNGQPTDEYLNEKCIPYTHASTDLVRRNWATSSMFLGFFGQKFDIKLKTPTGEVRSLSLVLRKSEEKNLIPPEVKKELFTFKWLEGQVAYLSMTSFFYAKIDTMFLEKLPELTKARGVIIDVRDQEGGNAIFGNYIAQYFLEDSLYLIHKSKTRKNISFMRALGGKYSASDTIKDHSIADAYNCFHNRFWEDVGTSKIQDEIPTKDRIIVPTVILMGHETGSAAESFVMCFDKSKHVIKMGENTFGTTGLEYVFELPGGAFGSMSTTHVTYPDGRKIVGIGVKPDIVVKRTVADVIHDRDPVLDEALKYLQSHK